MLDTRKGKAKLIVVGVLLLFTLSILTGSGIAPSAYNTIQEEGSALAKRPNLNFIGSTITCVDNGGSNRTDCTVTGGGSNSLYTSTADATVGNTGSELTLIGTGTGSLTLPAGYFGTIGNNLLVTATGYYSTKAPAVGNLTIKLKFGSTILRSAAAAPPGSMTNQRWTVNVLITGRTTGATGTVMLQTAWEHTDNGISPFSEVFDMTGTTTVTIDTTATQVVDLTAQWATSDVANTITGTNFVMYAIGPGVVTGGYQIVQDEGTGLTQRSTLNFAGAGVACADGAGKTTCTISGGGGGALTFDTFANIPATCTTGDHYLTTNSLYDLWCTATNTWNYFYSGHNVTPPPSTGWSWDNQGGSTIDSTNGYEYLYGASTSALQLRVRFRTAPATPYTVTALLLHDSNNGGNQNGTEAGYGLCFRQSTTGKIVTFNFDPNLLVATTKYTTATTFSADYKVVSNVPDTTHLNPRWVQVSDDGTNLIFRSGVDGQHWIQFDTRARGDFMTLSGGVTGPDQIGFVSYANQNNSAVALISWIVQ